MIRQVQFKKQLVQLDSQLLDQLRNQLWSQLWSQLGAQLGPADKPQLSSSEEIW